MKKPEFLADLNVFAQTKEEKAHAYTVKKKWQTTMRMFYGDKWKKHNNYPFTLSDI